MDNPLRDTGQSTQRHRQYKLGKRHKQKQTRQKTQYKSKNMSNNDPIKITCKV